MGDEIEETANGEKALSNAPPVELLSLRAVAEQSGWDYEKLRSYIRDAPAVNDYVHAAKKRGQKGVGYPHDSIPFFQKMLADVDAGKLVPTTLAGWLADLSPEANGETARGAAGTPYTQAKGQSVVLPVEVLQRLIAAVERQADAFKALPPPPAAPDDELLSMRAAHLRFGLSMKTLRGLRVKEGNVLKVRRTDCLRAIQNLSGIEHD